MQTPLERAQGRTLKEISSVLSTFHRWGDSDYARSSAFQWRRDQMVKEYSRNDPEKAAECLALMEWAVNNQQELEVYMAKRSPSTAANWSVRSGRRLCKEAEDIVKEKAKDRSTLLDYCCHFGIVLDSTAKITLKAAFEDGSSREKAYIKKIEHTKKKMKEFLEQMVGIGMVDQEMKVKDLIQNL
jgi:hypothetical protein